MSKINLKEASRAELELFVDSFDVVLCDCDGVLWSSTDFFSGVKETLELLAALGKRIKFVTNNTLHTLEHFCDMISEAYTVTDIDLITPTVAMIEHLKEKGINKKMLIIGSMPMKQEFTKAGFQVVQNRGETIEQNYRGLISIINNSDEDIGVVLADYDINMRYNELLTAAVCLQRPDVMFISGATENCVMINETKVIGPGYFKNILEDLTGKQATIFGKPSTNMNIYLQRRFNITDSKKVLFIGDTLEQDMCFASQCGYKKLLVLTGKAKIEDITPTLEEELTPDYYIPSLGDLHELIAFAK